MKTAVNYDKDKAREDFIHEEVIFETLEKMKKTEISRAKDALAKARELKGLEMEDVTALLQCEDPEMNEELFQTAHDIKEAIYGKRLVLFAPLYVSNLCQNNCLYCAFRAKNKKIKRRALTQDEIREEVEYLVSQGHKRILIVAGEAYPEEGLKYILKAIETTYSVKVDNGEVRRINVNIAPLTVPEFKELKATKIGTYQLFQETYHRPTYREMHPTGPKADYNWRITAPDRAFLGGIDDIGVGILFGLFDYKYEVLALLQHIRHLEARFGVGPHTISVPRLEPADGSEISVNPPYPVSDLDFKRIVAILRIMVPYTGIIMSTRETPKLRVETFAVGVSQISAGSRTNPGGYSEGESATPQFQLGDHRSLAEVIYDITKMGYIPSFCTACYRLGRTGEDFMDLAKPGLIKKYCLPNAILTFREYLEDYAGDKTKDIGLQAIEQNLLEITSEKKREETKRRLKRIEGGERDLYF